jgi:hypothetical protein
MCSHTAAGHPGRKVASLATVAHVLTRMGEACAHRGACVRVRVSVVAAAVVPAYSGTETNLHYPRQYPE